ncbi:MAG TPA: acetolactate synthase 2 small subunit [Candidatus Melainabacteria bacterium]|nr:acetolactate synthase 2 small subunit [Candidatus Melainabacteria bacterium]
MRYTFDISMKNSEGALERVLGRLRQRSFSLCSLKADSMESGKEMVARVTVESERSAEYAMKQIDKLYDVARVVLNEMVEETKQDVSAK